MILSTDNTRLLTYEVARKNRKTKRDRPEYQNVARYEKLGTELVAAWLDRVTRLLISGRLRVSAPGAGTKHIVGLFLGRKIDEPRDIKFYVSEAQAGLAVHKAHVAQQLLAAA